MTALVWDQPGEKFYETGIDRGVYYPTDGDGVAWNGLVSVRESVSGGDVTPYYIDGVKHLNVVENDDFEATLTAFAAPKEFIEGDGMRVLHVGFYASNQPRSSFGMSYRTLVGNDLDGSSHSYKLHLIYNAVAAPVEKTYATLSAQNSAPTFDWSISAVSVVGHGFKPTSHFELYSDEVYPEALTVIEDILYGASAPPRLPTIDEILSYILADYDPITDPIVEPV